MPLCWVADPMRLEPALSSIALSAEAALVAIDLPTDYPLNFQVVSNEAATADSAETIHDGVLEFGHSPCRLGCPSH
jgi:hypothetical protein